MSGLTVIIMIGLGMLLGLLAGEAWLMTTLLGETRWIAILAGGAIGGLAAGLYQQGQRIAALERRLGELDPGASEALEPAAESPAPPAPRPPKPMQEAVAAAASQPPPSPAYRTIDPPARTPPTKARGPGMLERIRQWFMRGNVPVKVGILVLLVGLAALLRHATEQGWLSFPIEWRLIVVALAALGLLAVGWRQRRERRVFGLSLQGGAIGALLLTLFAAVRLYQLMPTTAGFMVMVALVGGTVVLAVRQRAQSLAVFALLAGLASPLLLATEAGPPLVLFSWYAVLNLAIVSIAAFQVWPLLNRVGLVATLAVATLWGVLAWSPDYYGLAQCFLILFFAIYFLIPIFNARRGGPVEAVLVFGLPLLAFPLQIALLEGDRLPVALAAVMAAGLYLASALVLHRRTAARDLAYSHAVLAIGLATLAVPFAFSGPTLTVIWALEGAALVWFGCRQNGRWTRLSGLALQVVAGAVWLLNQAFHWGDPGMLILNRLYLGGLALSIAALLSAWCYQQAGASRWRVNLIAAAGLLAWLLSGWIEVIRQFHHQQVAEALVAFFALTTLLWAWLRRQQGWGVAAPVAAASLLACALLVFVQLEYGQPLAGLGAAAWLAVLFAALAADRCLALGQDRWRSWTLLASHLAVSTVLTASIAEALLRQTELGSGWIWLTASAPVLGLSAWLLAGHSPPVRLAACDRSQRNGLAGLVTLAMLLGLIASLTASGPAEPLPWLPLLNPLELGQLLALLLLARLAVDSRPERLQLPVAVPAALLLAALTSATLRANHQLLGIEWQLDALLAANPVQASLSVIWTLLGVLAWVLGSRRRSPTLWWAGAILMGIVLLKLLLIDRQFLSTVAGIVSFLAFGLLSILVGYLAPAPPSQTREHEVKP